MAKGISPTFRKAASSQPIAKYPKTGDRIDAARLEIGPDDVTFGHRVDR
jgi:hypothetical protein